MGPAELTQGLFPELRDSYIGKASAISSLSVCFFMLATASYVFK